ncbi:hypothetical protein PGLA_19570 [Paenibacillus glacialis]|uniref:Knr4/Smi1-like domain-containing protein n=2 Tax=Paenibacillus glacialis TaxID=494026 RepID=A0A162PT70_9BACL|nr:hypothetical protein PGLA_19570 [Paenibacillus glacialis]
MNFEYSFEKISCKDVENFEKIRNVTLPYDYKQFLLLNNGGKPIKRRFQSKDGKITSSLMMYFPISESVEISLDEKYKIYSIGKIVPSNFLPIGIDPADSLICLSVSGNDIGKVYFCDMDYFEEDNELKKEFISLISNSFTEFTGSLYIPE